MSLKAVETDYGLGKGFRRFLRKIVCNAALDEPRICSCESRQKGLITPSVMRFEEILHRFGTIAILKHLISDRQMN